MARRRNSDQESFDEGVEGVLTGLIPGKRAKSVARSGYRAYARGARSLDKRVRAMARSGAAMTERAGLSRVSSAQRALLDERSNPYRALSRPAAPLDQLRQLAAQGNKRAQSLLKITEAESRMATKRKRNGEGWWSAGQKWLEMRTHKDYLKQRNAWIRSGRSKSTFRFHPEDWHRNAVAALGRNDEQAFKAIKLVAVDRAGEPKNSWERRNPRKNSSTWGVPSKLRLIARVEGSEVRVYKDPDTGEFVVKPSAKAPERQWAYTSDKADALGTAKHMASERRKNGKGKKRSMRGRSERARRTERQFRELKREIKRVGSSYSARAADKDARLGRLHKKVRRKAKLSVGTMRRNPKRKFVPLKTGSPESQNQIWAVPPHRVAQLTRRGIKSARRREALDRRYTPSAVHAPARQQVALDRIHKRREISRYVGAWHIKWSPKRAGTVYVDGPKWSDSAIRYDDGRIAYDFPERIPATVKKAVAAVFTASKKPRRNR